MIRVRLRVFGAAAALFFSLSGVAHADTLGGARQFHTDTTYDSAGASSIMATLRVVGQNAYFYVDDRYWATLTGGQQQQYTALVNALANEFDTAIYPTATALWGNENKPGVDGDPRVTILLENLTSGSGGYFKTVNSYSQAQAPESNAREMVYISTASVVSDIAKSFVAHEFQHLISFNQKELLQRMVDDTWLNEARSEYDITAAGYSSPFSGSTLQRRAQVFLANSSDSLVEWVNTTTDYSIATIFAHYLADRFGPGLLVSTIHSHDNGVAAINDWLSQNFPTERFHDVFTDWMVASYANDAALGSAYAYARSGLDAMHVTPQYASQLATDTQYTLNTSLKEWQPLWMRFDVVSGIQPSALTIRTAGPAGSWSGGAVYVTYENGSRSVTPFSAVSGQGAIQVPFVLPMSGGARMRSVMLAVSQGTQVAVGDRDIPALPMNIAVSFGDTPVPTVTPASVPQQPVKDGDLVNHHSEAETYVVWGTYRRYLPAGVLQLYGFQDRLVTPVSEDIFGRYTTSNYVRAVDGTKVYALWPDGTKHWLNITPAQWDASGRDWNAIFIVNDAEVAFYQTGPDITR